MADSSKESEEVVSVADFLAQTADSSTEGADVVESPPSSYGAEIVARARAQAHVKHKKPLMLRLLPEHFDRLTNAARHVGQSNIAFAVSAIMKAIDAADAEIDAPPIPKALLFEESVRKEIQQLKQRTDMLDSRYGALADLITDLVLTKHGQTNDADAERLADEIDKVLATDDEAEKADEVKEAADAFRAVIKYWPAPDGAEATAGDLLGIHTNEAWRAALTKWVPPSSYGAVFPTSIKLGRALRGVEGVVIDRYKIVKGKYGWVRLKASRSERLEQLRTKREKL